MAVIVFLVAAVAMVLALKPTRSGEAPTHPAVTTGLPRLVDLGATSCIPCRKMAPILDELRLEFAGRFDVHFIDVWKNPGAGEPYGIRVIPTQIFFDGEGRELFRHEGFYSREQILGKWRDLGFTFTPATGPVAGEPG